MRCATALHGRHVPRKYIRARRNPRLTVRGRTTVSNASQRTTATIATPTNPEVARTLQPPVEKTADRPARADVAFAVYARSPRPSFFARDDHRTDHNGGAHPVLVRIRLEHVCTRRQRQIGRA